MRISCTFPCATLKNLMFTRMILALNCPLLSWHPGVSALGQRMRLCWVLCNGHHPHDGEGLAAGARGSLCAQ